MTLSRYPEEVPFADFQERLAAPFPSSRVLWKPQTLSADRRQALLVAYVDARTVMERLDEVCPEEWTFRLKLYPGTPLIARGELRVAGLVRSDVGEAGEGDAAGAKAAASDALKRCAVHFGIGRYLYDLPRSWVAWDDSRRQPAEPATLPSWALPEIERVAGVTHVLGALQTLRGTLPADVERLREVYRHLKTAMDAAGIS